MVALQSSKSMDASIHNCNNRNQQEKHSEDEIDSPSNVSFRRKNIFQSLKLKEDKIPLSHPSNACGRQFNDEQQNRRSTDGKLPPARVNILICFFFISRET
jgi:hypothetical protein